MSAQPLIHRQCLDERAVSTLKECIPIRKHYGPQSRVHKSRIYNGATPSMITHVLRTVDNLARGGGSDPWPLIVQAIITVNQAQIGEAAESALEYRLRELRDRFITLAANAQRMMLNAESTHLDRADAAKKVCNVAEEIAAIEQELAERARHRA